MVEDLCVHDGYISELRQELAQYKAATLEGDLKVEKMPLLDSFIKESIRHTSADAGKLFSLLPSVCRYIYAQKGGETKNLLTGARFVVSCRRRALHNYTLRSGLRVHKGDWICVPQRAMMHDETRYRCADQFDGFRFFNANASLQAGQQTDKVPDNVPSSLTTANQDWLIWGLGNTTW